MKNKNQKNIETMHAPEQHRLWVGALMPKLRTEEKNARVITVFLQQQALFFIRKYLTIK